MVQRALLGQVTAMHRIHAGQGTRADELPALKAGILALAGRGGIHCRPGVETPGEEASRLAEMTPPSTPADWEAALLVIGDHPQRENLIIRTGLLAMTGFTTAEHAAEMVMHIVGGERAAGAPEPPAL
jgi:hypothetical protein